MRKNVLLIDGNSLAFRAFFAMKAVLKDSMTIEAGTHLFDKWLTYFVSNIDPEFLAIAFDVDNRNSENNQVFDGYKEGRVIDPLLKSKFNQFINVPKKLGYYTIGLVGHEADDVLASLLDHFESPKWNDQFQKTIISGDKDLLQLVNDQSHTEVLSPMSGTNVKKWTNKEVLTKFKGIQVPEQVVDYKALVGDSSDGYHGVPNIGPGTAEKLLEEYKTFDNIYKALSENRFKFSQKIAQNLQSGSTHGYNSYKLAKLDRHVILPIKRLGELRRHSVSVDQSACNSR